MIIVQLTDPHVVERGQLQYGHIDTVGHLEAAIRHINAMEPAPDVVVMTGDLTNEGFPEQYTVLGELMQALEAPLLPLPGNHDVLDLFFATFEAIDVVPSVGSKTADYVVENYPVRMIALDTTIADEHGGRLAPTQIDWLDETLQEQPTAPTLVLMHHPPFVTGISWMDGDGFQNAEQLEAVIARHPQVGAVLCGHMHRPITTVFGNTMAMTCSSTAAEVVLELGDRYERSMIDEGPAVLVHWWPDGGRLVSHRSPIEPDAKPWNCWGEPLE